MKKLHGYQSNDGTMFSTKEAAVVSDVMYWLTPSCQDSLQIGVNHRTAECMVKGRYALRAILDQMDDGQ